MLYSYKGEKPAELPNRIRLSDGTTRTDKSTFTEQEISDAGYTIAPQYPAYNAEMQKVVWNSNTISWEVVDLTEQEINQILNAKWNRIREERDMLLEQSDVFVLKELESNGVVSQRLRDYRQALRDIPQTYETPSDVVWPKLILDE